MGALVLNPAQAGLLPFSTRVRLSRHIDPPAAAAYGNEAGVPVDCRRFGAVALGLFRRGGLDLTLAIEGPEDETAPEPPPPRRASSVGWRRFHRRALSRYARPARLDIDGCAYRKRRERDMSGMKLSEADYKALDEYLTAILNAYRDGEVDLMRARATLAHVMTVAVMGNEGGFKEHIRIYPTAR
jgi:hypothetical protein